MKRTERHHLKENELQIFARQARETLETKQREIAIALGAAAVLAAAAIGYFFWHERVQARAHAMLAEAVAIEDARVVPPPAPGTPPTPGAAPAAGTFPTEQARAEAAFQKLKAVAEKYPSSDAGIFARYEEATTLMSLGRPADAASRYADVIKRAGDGIYGQMARLGLAEARARGGQYDQAIVGFKELAQHKEGPLPIDGVLMQLGRTYLEAGRPADARQTFNRLVEEYPDSPFTGEARRELEGLKKT
jgi:TolA-binding protein